MLSKKTVGMETWTNATARQALGRVAPGQRAVLDETVRTYRGLLDVGRWFPHSATPIVFTRDGVLVNGVNRTTMISRLPDGVEVEVLVTRGEDPDALPYIDTGKGRTLGHHLRYGFPDYSQEQCATAAAIAKIAMTYRPPALPVVDKPVDPALVVKWVDEHEDEVFWATREAIRIVHKEESKPGSIMTRRTLGFVLYLLADQGDKVTTFFGEHAARWPAHGDPRWTLVQWYSRPAHTMPRSAQDRETTLRRIADLLGVWDASQRGLSRWRTWDEKPEHFRHPNP